jgi:hypothetical protein
VDIEIARWNSEHLADIQFLVQPPGDPHKYRFYSGAGTTYDQAPHIYKFDWRPAEIEWTSDAGGGHSFIYNTQMALDARKPDYTQCMPADVEVRLNVCVCVCVDLLPYRRLNQCATKGPLKPLESFWLRGSCGDTGPPIRRSSD